MLGRPSNPARGLGGHLRRLADIGALGTAAESVVPSEVHLTTPRVGDHEKFATIGFSTVRILRDCVEAADTVDRNAEGITERRRGDHADTQSGERTRSDTHDDRVEIGRCVSGLVEALEDLWSEDLRVGPGIVGQAHGNRGDVGCVSLTAESDEPRGHDGC